MARLIIQAPGVSESLVLHPGVNRLGRNATNEFPLEHPTISSAHCEIILGDDGVTVRDLGSTNGTFIDGQPVQQGRLAPGQRLRLGDLEMVLETEVPNVAIPKFGDVAAATVVLPDGALPCANHPDHVATDRCPKCQVVYCDSCVHVLRRAGGVAHRLCPECSAHCEFIGPPPKKKRRGFLGFLQKTLRLGGRGR